MESIETSDKKRNAKGAWPHLTLTQYILDPVGFVTDAR